MERLYRAVSKATNKYIEGYLVKESKTTYCFKEDYEANSDNDTYYICYDRMTDWGLPNVHCREEVYPKTIGQFTGFYDIYGVKIFEYDTFIPLYSLTQDDLLGLSADDMKEKIEDDLDEDWKGVVGFYNGAYVVFTDLNYLVYYNLNSYNRKKKFVKYIENYGEHYLPEGTTLLGVVIH